MYRVFGRKESKGGGLRRVYDVPRIYTLSALFFSPKRKELLPYQHLTNERRREVVHWLCPWSWWRHRNVFINCWGGCIELQLVASIIYIIVVVKPIQRTFWTGRGVGGVRKRGSCVSLACAII